MMWWTLSLCVLLVGVPLSRQDLVTSTSAPGEGSPDATTTGESVKNVKPTIRSLQVTSEIKYRYATTLVSTRIINVNNQSAEASFTLTLPESAFISQFLMDVKGKVYKAYVKEKEEAKKTYDQAVQAGQFAGHVALDARDSNQFTVSVNLEPHGKVTFNLTYEQLLSRDLGVYSNVINIDPKQIVEDMSVVVDIEEPSDITDLEVPEIQVSNEAVPDETKPNALAKIEDKSSNHKTVTWAPTPQEQKALNETGVSGQFIVKYDVDRTNSPQQILVDEGYFVHFFAPEDLPKLRKHVVFVLDYSGSMAGRKLQQLRDAMKKILSDLGPKDFFSIVVFQSSVEAWSPNKKFVTGQRDIPRWLAQEEEEARVNTSSTLDQDFIVTATNDKITLAQEYLNKYNDLGATNIMGGLRTGLELVNIGSKMWENESDPPQPIMVFLTDGLPNVEVYNSDEIVNKTKPLNNKECPIYSLGFGYDADLNFLRKLSLSNFGFARTIYEAADADRQLEKFYRTIASPLLTNVTFTYLPGQVDNSTSTKVEFPIFYNGSELVVAGKVNRSRFCVLGKEEVALGELTGVTANGPLNLNVLFNCAIFKPNKTRGPASHLEKTWAFLSIQQLLDKAESLDPGTEKNQTKKKALDLALQYSFVTSLTSLVVVKPDSEESSVDPTKVKPGAESYPQMLSGVAMAGLPAAPMYSGGFGASFPSGALYAQRPVSGVFPTHGMSGPPPLPPMSKSPIPYKSSQLIIGLGVSKKSYASASSYSSGIQPHLRLKNKLSPNRVSTRLMDYVPEGFRLPNNRQDSVMGFSTTAVYEEVTEHPATKVSVNDVKWLQSYLTNSESSGNVTVPLLGTDMVLGLNETDTSFGACIVNNVPGECRHFKFCALDVFQDDVSLFTPYQCPIPNRFLGVCCPKTVTETSTL